MIIYRLKEMGLTLPEVAAPLASYSPAKRSDNLVFVSGQLPLVDGKLVMTGPMTPERDIDEAMAAMEICFMNGLAAAGTVVDLDKVSEIERLGAFVASTPDFTDQHRVANGASNMATSIMGEAGIHARAAVGVPSLPLDATVELEMIIRVQ